MSLPIYCPLLFHLVIEFLVSVIHENLFIYILLEIGETTLTTRANNCLTLNCVHYILPAREIDPNNQK